MKDEYNNLDKFLTPDEAAVLIGYSPRHVYRLIERGQLRSFRRWGKTFLTREEIDEFQSELIGRRQR